MAAEEPQESPSESVVPTEAAAPETIDQFTPRYLKADEVRLFRSPLGSPRLEIRDQVSYARVAARRIRPLTDPEHYVSLWADEDTEIGIIRDPLLLDDESRQVLEEELDLRYFTPTISRIINVKERFGVHEWDVDTSRGRFSFSVRGLHNNVKQVSPARLLITDVRGNRYDIPNVSELDPHSFDLIQRHL